MIFRLFGWTVIRGAWLKDVRSVAALRVGPGDIVVFHLKEHASQEVCERLKACAQEFLEPFGLKGLVLSGGIELSAIVFDKKEETK